MTDQVLKLRRIGAISLGKIYMVISAVFGLIYGIIVAVIGSAVFPVSVSWFVGAASVFGGLIIGAIAGFLSGVFIALIYNVTAGAVGGVLLEFEGS